MSYDKDKTDSLTFIDTKKVEDAFDESKYRLLQKICEKIEGIFFYGGFKAETPNERELEKMMKKAGYWTYTEDEWIEKNIEREKKI